MFGFSLAGQFLQGSTSRTWNSVSNLAHLVWGKINKFTQSAMPRSRKRHHSRSRSKSRSRSHSKDRNYERVRKQSPHEKDGKRRRLDDIVDSPHKRSISGIEFEDNEQLDQSTATIDKPFAMTSEEVEGEKSGKIIAIEDEHDNAIDANFTNIDPNSMPVCYIKIENINSTMLLQTPKKHLTPKKMQKQLESEKKRLQKQKEKEERERQRQEEKAKIIAEKQKLKEQKEAEKQKVLEEKQKQLELKRKEREEKEQKRKEKEEVEAQKRKEKELEKLKKQQELDEKNKEKQKVEEKKQKIAALFKNFFKKNDTDEAESKVEKIYQSVFMPFEIKSDMKLAPLRRSPLTEDELNYLDSILETQTDTTYLKDLKSGKFKPGHSAKTWPYEEEADVTIIEDDKQLGEIICENTTGVRKMKAKFLFFHENRRPPYYGTWRKKSKCIKPRKPLIEDIEHFNYEEDSDDDWEEEEQGESLDVSGDDDEKDITNTEDDYEVDNEFFVPHGHLSDDEIDNEENARLSPDAVKQKLKLLKDEFEEDIKSKTNKLKSRSIGCVWLTKQGKIDDALSRYLQPFAMIVNGHIEINKGFNFVSPEKKKLPPALLPEEHMKDFLKVIEGNVHRKKIVVEEFLKVMADNGTPLNLSKANLFKLLKNVATYSSSSKCWLVNDDLKKKYEEIDLS
ncbi:hypothetical protein ABEB36_004226 [Hypothenemus hampei]|uniref:Chromatin assembly factor 1 subunit A n=1 Tax=Hypothenemus hampei TaxID=57062 RepID=A0ABD1F2Z6_HYPHA